MKVFKIRKYQKGSPAYPGLSSLSFKFEIPNLVKTTPQISSLQFPPLPYNITNSDQYKMAKMKSNVNETTEQWNQFLEDSKNQLGNPKITIDDTKKYNENQQQQSKSNLKTEISGAALNAATNYISNWASNKMFGDDSDIGRSMGTLFSSGISSTGSTIADNLIKGDALTKGLGKNVGSALEGAATGIAANYIGQGISSLGGNSRLSSAAGAGVASGLGQAKSIYNSIKTLKQANTVLKAGKDISGAAKAAQMASKASLWGAGMSIAGSALGAATGPSKEYGGKHGNITRTMDTVYDIASAAVNVIPGFGQLISGAMVLNKGLSNVFGSTSGMTTQDAILGSAFTPAPVKWLNMAGAKTTGTFKNQSWQNTEKTNSFMGNAFGDLSDKFDKAREEAGKTYGTFSRGAYNEAQENLDFATEAWGKILSMADQNELQNIRSQYMSSINNQRYAQQIGGGWQPIARGKLGMKIFNNATNHNIGMRLLSAAALIDNKAMILCNAHD